MEERGEAIGVIKGEAAVITGDAEVIMGETGAVFVGKPKATTSESANTMGGTARLPGEAAFMMDGNTGVRNELCLFTDGAGVITRCVIIGEQGARVVITGEGGAL